MKRFILLSLCLALIGQKAEAGFPGSDLVLPVVGRVSGGAGSEFYTTLWITNRSSSIASFELEMLMPPPAQSRTYSGGLAPGETRMLENFVEELFSLQALGAARIRSSADVMVSARIYNLEPGAAPKDSQGLFFSAIPVSFALSLGEQTSLQGVSQSSDFRYNLFLVETAGYPLTAKISVKSADGHVAGSRDYFVTALSPLFIPLSEIAPSFSGNNGLVEIQVTTGEGRLLVAGSQTANGSNDGTGFEMAFNPAVLDGAAPRVTSLNGLSGSLTLQAGPNVTITPSGSVLTISATGGGAGTLSLPFTGVYGSTGAAMSIENTNGPAVLGTTRGDPEVAYAVMGQNPRVGSLGYLGSWFYGVGGITEGNLTAGVYGANFSNRSFGYLATGRNGVEGYTSSPDGAGVYGESRAVGGSGYAGQFKGRVNIVGTLEKSAGSFKIDHPLDPENKYLYHSFVESPDMKNIYDGVVIMDAQGEAMVQLPEWFEALNGDFRYQLTCIGGYAPVFVSSEIAGNQFRISGGRAGLKVSWQVTGTRQDAYARTHRIAVEEEKPASERGTYLNPSAFGEPEQKGLVQGRTIE